MMTSISYQWTLFLLSMGAGILGGVLYMKHRSPLSKVPTTKEEIDKIEFEKYYELTDAQLTDLSELRDLAERVAKIEARLGLINGDNIEEAIKVKKVASIPESQIQMIEDLDINDDYKVKLYALLELEAKGYSEEEICSKVNLTKGEVEVLKDLLEA